MQFTATYLAAIAILWSLSSFAQKIYTGISAGYGIPLASQNISIDVDISELSTIKRIVHGSFGGGFYSNAFIGYGKKGMAIELHFTYNKSENYRSRQTINHATENNNTLSAWMLRVSPLMGFSVPADRVKPFFKFGPAFRLAGTIVNSMYKYDVKQNTVIDGKWKYTKGWSAGITSMAGLEFEDGNVKYFMELFIIAQSWAPKRGDIVAYQINGIDMMSHLNAAQKHTHFEKTLNQGNRKESGWEPAKELRQFFPFSTFGIRLGIEFKFSKEKKKAEES